MASIVESLPAAQARCSRRCKIIDLGQFGLPRPDRADRKPQRGTKIVYSEPPATTRDGDGRATIHISRRAFGVPSAAALAFRAQRARAGGRDVFVFGQDLPANLCANAMMALPAGWTATS